MKRCELCGLANPEEARFCMKCGKDLDNLNIPEAPSEEPEYKAFTPSGSTEHPYRKASKSPEVSEPLDDSGAVDETAQGYVGSPAPEMWQEAEDGGPLEIEPAGVTADFASRQKHCDVCGSSNPRDQKFCKVCGKPMEIGGGPQIDAMTLTAPATFEQSSDNVEKITGTDTAAGPIGSDGEGTMGRVRRATSRGEPPADEIYCGRCGHGNPAGVEFCHLCGIKIKGSSEEGERLALESAPLIPRESAPLEPAQISPHHPSFEIDGTVDRPPASGERTGSVLHRWGVREWSTMTLVALVIFGVIWMFGFGGYKRLFDNGADNLGKARSAMSSLGSYRLSVDVTLEKNDLSGSTKGGGNIEYEAPDRSAYDISYTAPNNVAVETRHIQINQKSYLFAEGGWQASDPVTTGFDVAQLWSQFSLLEELQDEVLNGVPCLHYKYRVPPEAVTKLLGVWKPAGSADAIVESWIDKSNHHIIHLSAEVFNLEIEGSIARAILTMDLAAMGQPYNISAPI